MALPFGIYRLSVHLKEPRTMDWIGKNDRQGWEETLLEFERSQNTPFRDPLGALTDFLLKRGYRPLHQFVSRSNMDLTDGRLKVRATDYWDQRKDFNYYKVVKDWIEQQSPGKLLIDVGSNGTPIATWGRFEKRISVDIVRKEMATRFEGVEEVISDYLDFVPAGRADLVTCCQVLEHLPDGVVERFARKLLQDGTKVIISVPYNWEKGRCVEHPQDPVDLEKLVAWTGKQPLKSEVVDDKGILRLVALFSGE